MKRLLMNTMLGMLFASLLGCATLMTLLPKVIATITDAQMILDEIENFVDAFFAVQPDPPLQNKVTQALDNCRTSLNIALRTTTGAKDLTERDVEAAFKEFQKAYAELLVLVQPLGVVQGDTGDKLSIGPKQLVVPPPLALKPTGK